MHLYFKSVYYNKHLEFSHITVEREFRFAGHAFDWVAIDLVFLYGRNRMMSFKICDQNQNGTRFGRLSKSENNKYIYIQLLKTFGYIIPILWRRWILMRYEKKLSHAFTKKETSISSKKKKNNHNIIQYQASCAGSGSPASVERESRKFLTFTYRVLSGHDVHYRCKYYNIIRIISDGISFSLRMKQKNKILYFFSVSFTLWRVFYFYFWMLPS